MHILRFIKLLSVWMLVTQVCVVFAAPRITSIYPAGAMRGKSVEVTIQGTGLKDLRHILVQGNGVQLSLMPGTDDTSRKAMLTVASDAAPGRREVRFADEREASNVRVISIGQVPEVNEVEPNNTPDKVTLQPLPICFNGRLSEGSDRDGFKVRLRKGQVVLIEVEGLRVLANIYESWLKGFLEVTDANGRPLATNQGTVDDYYRWDPVLRFDPPADGEYTIWFRDLNWRSDTKGVYRVTIGELPHAFATFPIGAQRGARITPEPVGATAAGMLAVFGPVNPDATLGISDVMFTAGGFESNHRPFLWTKEPSLDVTSGGLTRETAIPVQFPVALDGWFEPGKPRWVSFDVKDKGWQHINGYAWRLGVPTDLELKVYDAAGNLVQEADDGRGTNGGQAGGRDPFIAREFTPGKWFVRIRDVDDHGGKGYPFRVLMGAGHAILRGTFAPDAAGIPLSGGDIAVTVKCERVDLARGDIQVELIDAPPGIKVVNGTIATGKTEAAITIKVAAGALPVGLYRIRIRARCENASITLVGNETYNNQGTAYQRETDGLIIVVRPG